MIFKQKCLGLFNLFLGNYFQVHIMFKNIILILGIERDTYFYIIQSQTRQIIIN